jgi:hypothetical protein
MTRVRLLYSLMIGLVLLLSACNMPGRGLSAVEKTALIETSVARTVAAGEGETLTPSDTPDLSVATTEIPPTWTPAPDTATPSDTPIPCNLGKFVSDVTIPDGSVFEPGEAFTKTWRLKNVGSCAWTSGYDIVFAGGDGMGGPSSVQLTTGTVNPGQNVDVSVHLTAPATAGTFRGNWQLRDPDDVIFGIENSNSGYFWVQIKVVIPTDTPGPVTATLHRSSSSKTISVGGTSSDTRAGIAGNGDPLRAFLDFNLGSLTGLSSSSTIQSATIDLSSLTGYSCFDTLVPLKAGQVSYGTTPVYPDDFNEVPSASLISAPSALGISSPVSITSILQSYVSAHGAGHFQVRVWFDNDDAGSSYSCITEWTDPLLNITYLP